MVGFILFYFILTSIIWNFCGRVSLFVLGINPMFDQYKNYIKNKKVWVFNKI